MRVIMAIVAAVVLLGAAAMAAAWAFLAWVTVLRWAGLW